MCKKIIYGLIIFFGLALKVQVKAAEARTGKFYIVGMGSSPDLLTLRGQRVIQISDLIIIESKNDIEVWKQFIGKKPVIFAPHLARVYYGTDPGTLTDPNQKALAEKNSAIRKDLVEKIQKAVEAGKIVAYLQWGDPMMFGNVYLLEMLPSKVPTEVIPGIGAFQSGSAALKRNTVYGWDTNSVILTMGEWPGRMDTNDRLAAIGTSMVFYSMGLNYPELFDMLAKAFPVDTPVAVVSYAGDPKKEAIIQSTVGNFIKEVDYARLTPEMHTLFVGKFLTMGQARKDGVIHGKNVIEMLHGNDLPPGEADKSTRQK